MDEKASWSRNKSRKLKPIALLRQVFISADLGGLIYRKGCLMSANIINYLSIMKELVLKKIACSQGFALAHLPFNRSFGKCVWLFCRTIEA